MLYEVITNNNMNSLYSKISEILAFKTDEKVNYMVGFTVLGVVFVILAWIIGFMFGVATLSLKGIWELHKVSPVYFAIDALPLLFAFIGSAISKQYQNDNGKLIDVIKEKDDIINKNARFAKKIGDGELSAKLV